MNLGKLHASFCNETPIQYYFRLSHTLSNSQVHFQVKSIFQEKINIIQDCLPVLGNECSLGNKLLLKHDEQQLNRSMMNNNLTDPAADVTEKIY